MAETNKSLDDLVRDELGEEPSQEAKDYARELYERYRLPAPTEGGGAQEQQEAGTEG
ncbi:hypothetical protein [Nocardiopsis tropica]|jgi:hypothetical protein|uniref:Uncharacterized protein n=1 Tax=Nocardiopsis tropica TaxID=109330 RepID=A0ABU7KW79_9ACTN|nr:hypothetical protein [Nocardiopsis umidischolae]MEE2053565.1 hypothetical protein [Nocardiopsis umidischolae]